MKQHPKMPSGLGDPEEFKAQKRRELKRAYDDLRECNFGAAYTPASENISKALFYIENAIDNCSSENWKDQ